MTFTGRSIFQMVAKVVFLTRILISENLREPTAILWAGIAPCIMFIFLAQAQLQTGVRHLDYTVSSAWYYSYIAANAAFFGFSFYLIGRRESGFVRSFIYKSTSIKLFLFAHTVCYLLISLAYSTLFYIATKPFYGGYSVTEFLHLTACFFVSYLAFSSIGLVAVALPLRFSTASTVFSLLSFWMLLSGYLGSAEQASTLKSVGDVNPLYLATRIFSGEISLVASFCIAATALAISLFFTGRFFRIQPVWSRY